MVSGALPFPGLSPGLGGAGPGLEAAGVEPVLEVAPGHPPLPAELDRRQFPRAQHPGDHEGGHPHVLADVGDREPLLAQVHRDAIHGPQRMGRGARWQGCRGPGPGAAGPASRPYTPGAMAQPKPKKKPRSRSDPARREAAARRDEARRLAAEERRREQEAAERRQKLKKTARRLAVPVLAGLGVVVAAIFLFRPEKELAGVEKVDTAAIMAGLGYVLPGDIDAPPRRAARPGVRGGGGPDRRAVVLRPAQRGGGPLPPARRHRHRHRPGGPGRRASSPTWWWPPTTGSPRRCWPSPGGTARPTTPPDDPGLAEFADVYRQRGRAGGDCPSAGRLRAAGRPPERLNRAVTSADALVRDRQPCPRAPRRCRASPPGTGARRRGLAPRRPGGRCW